MYVADNRVWVYWQGLGKDAMPKTQGGLLPKRQVKQPTHCKYAPSMCKIHHFNQIRLTNLMQNTSYGLVNSKSVFFND